MDDSSFEDQLADDLKAVANALRTQRKVPDGHLLERVLYRVRSSGSRPRRRLRLLSPQTAVMAILGLAVVAGVRLSHLNPVNTVATLAGSVSNPVSSSPSGQAADWTYCPEGPGGWAPTFRWHYGQPTPDSGGFDDGWSPSVQPDCDDGALKITLTDRITVARGTAFWAGYDFHAANQAVAVTTTGPTVTLNLACASGTPSQSTYTKSWNGQSYNGPANTWTPDGNNKTALSGFQSGSFTLPPVCGAGKSVIVTGGTFYTSVVAHYI